MHLVPAIFLPVPPVILALGTAAVAVTSPAAPTAVGPPPCLITLTLTLSVLLFPVVLAFSATLILVADPPHAQCVIVLRTRAMHEGAVEAVQERACESVDDEGSEVEGRQRVVIVRDREEEEGFEGAQPK
jgi:hypothetical protein